MDGVAKLTHADVLGLLTGIVPVANITKYRVSSIVIDPINSASSVVSAEVTMGLSGNTFQSSLAQRPLKIRFGKDYGDDGMWIVTDGAALTDAALPGNEATTDTSMLVDLNGATVSQVEVHYRFAWQDPT